MQKIKIFYREVNYVHLALKKVFFLSKYLQISFYILCSKPIVSDKNPFFNITLFILLFLFMNLLSKSKGCNSLVSILEYYAF